MVFMTDTEGMILYTNPSFERIYGLTKQDWDGKTPRILSTRIKPPDFYKKFWKDLKSKKTVRAEFTNRTKSGELVVMESNVNPVINSDGNLVAFLAIQRDVTKQKTAEEQMVKKNRDLERLNKLMVGRELKMAQLKAEIKEFKSKPGVVDGVGVDQRIDGSSFGSETNNNEAEGN